MTSKDIATRVASGVQALGLDGTRESWQAQHRAGLLTDAQSYDALADALEADLKQRKVDGDMPWSAALRAKQRVKPLREAARSMRKAAKAVNATVASYEKTDPQKVATERQEKALKKAQKKGQVAAIANNSANRVLDRMNPAEKDGEAAGSQKVLGDFFNQKKGA